MATANEVQHEALVNLMKALPTIRRLNRTDSAQWTAADGLHARSILCFLDSYLTMKTAATSSSGAPSGSVPEAIRREVGKPFRVKHAIHDWPFGGGRCMTCGLKMPGEADEPAED